MLLGKHKTFNRYRSVKYKLNRDLSLCSEKPESEKKTANTTKYSLFKPKHRPSLDAPLHATDLKRQKTDKNQECPEQYRKSSYLDTFHSLFHMEKNKSNQMEKPHNRSIKNQIRVQLPALNELDSEFTVLDNINLPINYIQTQIEKLGEELKVYPSEFDAIRKSLQEIQKARINQLTQIEDIGKKGIKKLQNLLKVNKITHQQSLLNNKSSYKKCITYLPEFQQNLQSVKQRILELQHTIFQAHPFELETAQVSQILQNPYF